MDKYFRLHPDLSIQNIDLDSISQLRNKISKQNRILYSQNKDTIEYEKAKKTLDILIDDYNKSAVILN